MITLKRDKQLIRLGAWDELTKRFAFREKLDHKEHKLESVIGRYIEPEKRRCGLTSCRTLHNKGYVVTTTDGFETNIGKDCGKKYFGIDFAEMAQRFDRDLENQERLDYLWSFRYTLDDLQEKVTFIQRAPFGAHWAHSWINCLTQPGSGCPKTVIEYVKRVQRSRSPQIMVARLATEAERELLKTQRRIRKEQEDGPIWVDEPVANLNSIECLFDDNNLRSIMVDKLIQPMKEFSTVPIDSLSPKQLREWVVWAQQVDPNIDRAKAAVASARQFLEVENLKKFLLLLADSPKERSEFNSLLKQIANSKGR